MTHKKIRIVLADDHHMFLEGLNSLFSADDDITVVGLALNGSDALELLEKEQADILVTDINMPGMDGITLNTATKKKYPHVKTLILSTYSDLDKIIKLIHGKANGYLLKNAAKEELLKAIHELADGRNYFSKEIQEKYTNSVFSIPQDDTASSEDAVLSKREKEILKYIAAEYTTQQIAEKLFISQHTVNTHRRNLISKLGVKNMAGWVRYAFQKGLS